MCNDLGDSIDIGGTSCDRAVQTTWIEHDQLHPEPVSSAPLLVRAPSDPGFHRENFSDTEQYLKGLGATHVVTYDQLEDKSFFERVKEWTGDKVGTEVPHGLTC